MPSIPLPLDADGRGPLALPLRRENFTLRTSDRKNSASQRLKMDVKTAQNVSKIADFTCRILILRSARTFRFGLGQPLPQGGDLFLQAFDALAGGDECDLGSEGRGGRGRQLLVVPWRRVCARQR